MNTIYVASGGDKCCGEKIRKEIGNGGGLPF